MVFKVSFKESLWMNKRSLLQISQRITLCSTEGITDENLQNDPFFFYSDATWDPQALDDQDPIPIHFTRDPRCHKNVTKLGKIIRTGGKGRPQDIDPCSEEGMEIADLPALMNQ